MKKKIIIAGSLVLAIAVTVFGLFTYQNHQKQEIAKQEREKYQKLFFPNCQVKCNKVVPLIK